MLHSHTCTDADNTADTHFNGNPALLSKTIVGLHLQLQFKGPVANRCLQREAQQGQRLVVYMVAEN